MGIFIGCELFHNQEITFGNMSTLQSEFAPQKSCIVVNWLLFTVFVHLQLHSLLHFTHLY